MTEEYLNTEQLIDRLNNLACPECNYIFTEQDHCIERVGSLGFRIECPHCHGIQTIAAVAVH